MSKKNYSIDMLIIGVLIILALVCIALIYPAIDAQLTHQENLAIERTL